MMIKKFLFYFLVSCTVMASEEKSDVPGVATTSTIQATDGPSKIALVEKTQLSSGIQELPTELWLRILQCDRRNTLTFLSVCKTWRHSIVEDQKMERAIINSWQRAVFPFTLEETRKGFSRFMNYLPPLVHPNGTLFSRALRTAMTDFLGDTQEQMDQWKGQLKAIGLPVMDQPLVFQNQPTFCSLKQIFIAHQNLNRFLFFSSHKDIGNLILEIASLATNGMSQKNMNNCADQISTLFTSFSKSEERTFLKNAGSIYKGWRSLQPKALPLVESDNRTSFGRFLLSPEISYNRKMYKEEKDLLPSQLSQLAQSLLDYVTRAEKAQNDLLISLIQ